MMEKRVHQRLKTFINKNRLISKGDELILGVSGGADSMMMLHYFYSHRDEYGISLKVAHIHHGLREAANEDALLVENTCKAYGLPFFRHDCKVDQIAREKKISEEEAGRLERYNFFISLLNQNSKIVTAHNMNDQAETMLMRFLRGTDLKGLAGISVTRQKCIIRPLLCLTREEIEAYCKALDISFRHDETNFKPIYTRNKMRLIGIPYIKEHFNPNIISTLGRHSELYEEENDFIESYTKACFEKCSQVEKEKIILNSEILTSFHSYIQKNVFMVAISKLIGSKDITLKHLESCEKLLALQVGKEITLPGGLCVKKDYTSIILSVMKEEAAYCYDLALGCIEVEEKQLWVYLRKLGKTEYLELQRINQKNENNYTKYIDYGKIKSGLQIRTRKTSDFITLGNGTKKLKKLFTDDKISKTLRNTLPLIADGNEIIWVVGSRLNTKYYVTNDTEEVLEIKILTESK